MKKDDLSQRVDIGIRKAAQRRAVQEVQVQNSDLSEEEAMALANEAVAWARENPS